MAAQRIAEVFAPLVTPETLVVLSVVCMGGMCLCLLAAWCIRPAPLAASLPTPAPIVPQQKKKD